MITLNEAKQLRVGDILYHTAHLNANGTSQRWKVNGMVKTWKRNSNRISIPVKHGLYLYDYITENDLHLVSLTEVKK